MYALDDLVRLLSDRILHASVADVTDNYWHFEKKIWEWNETMKESISDPTV